MLLSEILRILTASFLPAGNYEVSIKFNDEHIPESPYLVPVIAPSDDARRLTVTSLQVRHKETSPQLATQTDFVLVLRDQNGCPFFLVIDLPWLVLVFKISLQPERFLAASLLVTWASRAGPALASQNLKAERSTECITGGNTWELRIRGSRNSIGGAKTCFLPH